MCGRDNDKDVSGMRDERMKQTEIIKPLNLNKTQQGKLI
jgi:hypothetical protein